MSTQLSTEEQAARYHSKTPEQQEINRLARIKRRAEKKAWRKSSANKNAQKKRARKRKSDETLIYNESRFKEKIAALPPKLICLDLEQYERHQPYLTEVGITTIDTATWDVSTIHLIVSEHYKRRNKKFVCDNKDNFQFGKSEHVSKAQALQILKLTFEMNKHAVGHSILGDFEYLEKNHCLKCGNKSLTLFDTGKLYGVIHKQKNRTSLKTVCEHYGITHSHPHNAGNDSHITAIAFIVMLKQFMDNTSK